VTLPPSELQVTFTAECVSAIKAGRKRQARRVVRADDERPFGGAGERLQVTARAADSRQQAVEVTVEVEEVRRERLQSIRGLDIAEEGNVGSGKASAEGEARAAFATWWDSLHSRVGTRWDDNPEVWVVRFHLIGEELDA
jgi:hypothetical protein